MAATARTRNPRTTIDFGPLLPSLRLWVESHGYTSLNEGVRSIVRATVSGGETETTTAQGGN
jgi:hypothetical protein